MFNLVVVQDAANKTLLIEPYNTYYNEPDRQEKDWSNKLDLTSAYRIEPLSFNLAKELSFQYEKGSEEYLNKIWEDTNDYNYGRFRYVANSNILTDLSVYEMPFAALPTSGVTNAPNLIIPQVWRDLNNQQAPYSSKPHLFFWVGNRLAWKDQYKTQQGSWYLSSGSTAVEWTTYPCVSHLSTLESQISEVISDLNFKSTFDFFGNTNTQIEQFTDFNVYNSFWKTYIDNLYDPTGKRLTGNFYFRPIDVYETNLNDKVWIKDSWYSIEKITDADLVNKRLTQISLIKDNVPYYRIEPPAPIYIYGPNEGYPGPTQFYYDLAFISSNQDSVCNQTATQFTFYSDNNSLTIENYDVIYTDLVGPTLLPMGTYIRQQNSATTFVCVDPYGRVLQTSC
jgi:hypothetical protein